MFHGHPQPLNNRSKPLFKVAVIFYGKAAVAIGLESIVEVVNVHLLFAMHLKGCSFVVSGDIVGTQHVWPLHEIRVVVTGNKVLSMRQSLHPVVNAVHLNFLKVCRIYYQFGSTLPRGTVRGSFSFGRVTKIVHVERVLLQDKWNRNVCRIIIHLTS